MIFRDELWNAISKNCKEKFRPCVGLRTLNSVGLNRKCVFVAFQLNYKLSEAKWALDASNKVWRSNARFFE